jgi:hypothetical protein
VSTMNVRHMIVVAAGLAALVASAPVRAQQPGIQVAHSNFVAVGLFIAGIEEGARIFTPVRLLPFAHAEAMGHEFPTVEQFHGGEERLLVSLGRHAGLLLGMTLQRYPTEPDSAWPYAPFQRPPAELFAALAPMRRPASESPLPGLRAVAYLDRVPLGFIIDTRGLSLEARHMTRTTSSGLDVTRAQVLSALTSAAQACPATGACALVFGRR